jgi:CO/xanthine dehydrogenase FAD-binding subunit
MINVLTYKRPVTLKQAIELMASGEFSPIAGGTDLILQLRHGKPKNLLDVSLLGLDLIKDLGDTIEIGAAVTHGRLSSDPIIRKFLPVLSRAAGLVGSLQIRNRGTVGGNIVNASPCADTAPALLVYDTEVILKSNKGERRIKLSEFMTAPYSTLLQPNELLYSFICKKAPDNSNCTYIKLGRRQAVNISRMSIAVSLCQNNNKIVQSVQIAGGSIFPAPSRLLEVENKLTGQSISEGLFEEAGDYAAELMIKHSGYRWSTPYKQPVLAGLIKRALAEVSSNRTNKK